MYLKASDVRALAELASWDDCVDGRLCYAAPMGPEAHEDTYGIPLDEFIREYPFVADRVDVQTARCPDAIPEILVWLVAGETALPLPTSWRGYPVIQRGPVYARPLGAFGVEDPIPSPDPQAAEFPIGPAVVSFGIVLGVFVLSFFVKRSPAGRWYLGARRS